MEFGVALEKRLPVADCSHKLMHRWDHTRFDINEARSELLLYTVSVFTVTYTLLGTSVHLYSYSGISQSGNSGTIQ